MAMTLGEIVELYRTAGAARYGMEAVDQERHAMQCAALAEGAGAPVALVAAALLHDLGHLLPDDSAGFPGADDLHEWRALPFLRGRFGDRVLEPIRLHVAAKRYLCATRPGYQEGLSAASRHSLALQGGAFSTAEAAEFMLRPHAADAVRLRLWDDQAKSPTRITPGWEHWRRVLEQAM